MIQLAFDFVLVPLVRVVRPRIVADACNGFHITLTINNQIVTALVPDWVIGKGTSFVRGWLKAGG
ncbi:hypothetical protein NX722_05745 [Endozoicomonas gorgoniicola]|uniref:Uncharacterized protein n=1 Tax=Endozoicomonas gorgoniicola TaxID=1234144 RepID=A0ABT3MS02_9GAMM|nr:hypothetical protein [Endozoicomonas gorgoniicola]MCW7552156.1 hypothetical protein [Endozoicomonas gorgoniicola]